MPILVLQSDYFQQDRWPCRGAAEPQGYYYYYYGPVAAPQNHKVIIIIIMALSRRRTTRLLLLLLWPCRGAAEPQGNRPYPSLAILPYSTVPPCHTCRRPCGITHLRANIPSNSVVAWLLLLIELLRIDWAIGRRARFWL